MNITQKQLINIYKEAPAARVLPFLDHLNGVFEEFDISTYLRVAMFLAQIGHESGQLRYVKEIASGQAYEGRKDLGNISPGDGVKYKGRGLIQITGKTNYILCGMALNLPLIEHPELLELPENATRSAGWFWHNKKLNALADIGDINKCTRIINGGFNGLSDRVLLYKRALMELK